MWQWLLEARFSLRSPKAAGSNQLAFSERSRISHAGIGLPTQSRRVRAQAESASEWSLVLLWLRICCCTRDARGAFGGMTIVTSTGLALSVGVSRFCGTGTQEACSEALCCPGLKSSHSSPQNGPEVQRRPRFQRRRTARSAVLDATVSAASRGAVLPSQDA